VSTPQTELTAPNGIRWQIHMKQRQILIIWLALLWAIVLYFLVMRLVKPASPSGDEFLANVLVGVSLMLAVVSIPLRKNVADRNRALGYLFGAIFCDTAALMGVVSWFVTGSSRAYFCLIIGLLAMLIHYPGRDQGD
jgi:hypothetical protein